MKRTIIFLTAICLALSPLASCTKPERTLTAAELLDLGEKYLLDLDYEQAIVQFTKLIEIKPKNARAYTGLAEAYTALGRTDDAIEALERGLDATGGSSSIQRELDRLLEETIGSADAGQSADPSASAGQTAASDSAVNTIILQIGNPNMMVNGTVTAIDANGSAPTISGGASMLPLRGVLEILGGTVAYDTDSQSTTASFGGHTAIILAGNDLAYIDGAAVRLAAAPLQQNGSLYAPARLFADAFGASVSWNTEAQSTTLTYSGAAIDASTLRPPVSAVAAPAVVPTAEPTAEPTAMPMPTPTPESAPSIGQAARGTIEITDVTPKTVTPGAETTFSVTVRYTSANIGGCVIYAGANTGESQRYALYDEYILPNASGTYTFNFACTPTAWPDNAFGIYVNMSEYPHPDSWMPLDFAVYDLAVAAAPVPVPVADYITIKGERYSTSLKKLDLRGKGLTSADIEPLRYMTDLTTLFLVSNQISNFSPLAGLSHLTSLGLGDNQISDLSPLIGLTNLTALHLGLNQISDISLLVGLTNLTELGLASNQISDLSPLAGLSNLTYLDLGDNPITDWSPVADVTFLLGRP
jgi:hypothetical protein